MHHQSRSASVTYRDPMHRPEPHWGKPQPPPCAAGGHTGKLLLDVRCRNAHQFRQVMATAGWTGGRLFASNQQLEFTVAIIAGVFVERHL